MDILDNIEEYKKLINNVDNHFLSNIAKKEDLETRIANSNKSIEELKKFQLELDNKMSLLNSSIDSKLLSSNKDIIIHLNEHKQNFEEYKKITNDRIEKLVKLFLSINK